MTYEHQKELSRKREASNNLKRLRGKIYHDSETFAEYQMLCAVNGVHHKRFFDRFWYYYLCKNYGQAQFNAIIGLVFCLASSALFITVMTITGLSMPTYLHIIAMLIINFLSAFFSITSFAEMNRTTKCDCIP